MEQQGDSLARLVPYQVDLLLPGHGLPAFADGSDHVQLYGEALEGFNKILKAAPELEEAVMGKGFALLGLGRVEEALQPPGFAARLKELI
jgi:Flp pilus assembly protein TadD